MASRASRSWRWPWRPPVGMVRISKDAYIETLRGALRAAELEVECCALEAQIADRRCQAAARARAVGAASLLVERTRGAAVVFNDLEVRGLLAGLPSLPDGLLNEDAFLAGLDEHIWSRRLDAVTTTT